MDSMLRIVRLAASGALVAAVLAGSATPVVAECDGPIPSFRDALSTAGRIVIGDVTAVHRGGLVEPGPDGESSRFTLAVRYVLRGEASAEIEIRDLATQPCAPGVQARVGDRIAIAFDATAFTPPIQVNTVAWVRGATPAYWEVERITVAETFRLLGRTAPDTATVAPARSPEPTRAPLALLASALVGLVLGWRRMGWRTSRAREG
jgi:hypothetical protein